MARRSPQATAGIWQTLFFAFTLAMAAGPLDRFIIEETISPLIRTCAWAFIYSGFLALFLTKPRQSFDAMLSIWPLWLMPGFALISITWSLQPLPTAMGTLQLGVVVGFGAIMASIADERRILNLVVSVYTLLAAINLAFYLSNPAGAVDINDDVVGMFSHKNTNGEVMATLVFASLAALVWRGWRIPAMAGILLGLPMLFLSGSRTAWLAAFAGSLAVILPLFRRVSPPGRIALGLGGFAGLCFLAILLAGGGVDLVGQFLSVIGKDSTLTGRTVLWDIAINHIQHSPILGTGFNAFWSLDNTSDAAVVHGVMAERLLSFHNGFLELTVELGFVGLAIAVGIIVAMITPLRRLMNYGDPAGGSFAIALLLYCVISNMAEVSLFVRHGFNLLIFAALWRRSLMVSVPRKQPTKAFGLFGHPDREQGTGDLLGRPTSSDLA